MERNFISIRCPEGYKKDIAVYFLGEKAYNWWTGMVARMANPEYTWAVFCGEFRAKYFPLEASDRLETEFLELRQGMRTIRELEVEFNQLLKYAGKHVEGEEAHIRWFRRAMRIDLHNRVGITTFTTLTELVEKTPALKSGLEEEARLRGEVKPAVSVVPQAKNGSMSG